MWTSKADNIVLCDYSLPLLFYLKLFGSSISRREKILDYFLLAVSITLSTVGTVWAFLPKSLFVPDEWGKLGVVVVLHMDA